jgi:hypothetical protein
MVVVVVVLVAIDAVDVNGCCCCSQNSKINTVFSSDKIDIKEASVFLTQSTLQTHAGLNKGIELCVFVWVRV